MDYNTAVQCFGGILKYAEQEGEQKIEGKFREIYNLVIEFMRTFDYKVLDEDLVNYSSCTPLFIALRDKVSNRIQLLECCARYDFIHLFKFIDLEMNKFIFIRLITLAYENMSLEVFSYIHKRFNCMDLLNKISQVTSPKYLKRFIERFPEYKQAIHLKLKIIYLPELINQEEICGKSKNKIAKRFLNTCEKYFDLTGKEDRKLCAKLIGLFSHNCQYHILQNDLHNIGMELTLFEHFNIKPTIDYESLSYCAQDYHNDYSDHEPDIAVHHRKNMKLFLQMVDQIDPWEVLMFDYPDQLNIPMVEMFYTKEIHERAIRENKTELIELCNRLHPS
jgi:hypothetical protein